ncbi:unnamed protein product [Polarella glacialis]|uniref:Uncharacterized protein n=1 Tax=Polarella glacialis TaxID=89957 RepID=A0A813H254_POLGL|nr:unnamed protein product [Polarella glacialis]
MTEKSSRIQAYEFVANKLVDVLRELAPPKHPPAATSQLLKEAQDEILRLQRLAAAPVSNSQPPPPPPLQGTAFANGPPSQAPGPPPGQQSQAQATGARQAPPPVQADREAASSSGTPVQGSPQAHFHSMFTPVRPTATLPIRVPDDSDLPPGQLPEGTDSAENNPAQQDAQKTPADAPPPNEQAGLDFESRVQELTTASTVRELIEKFLKEGPTNNPLGKSAPVSGKQTDFAKWLKSLAAPRSRKVLVENAVKQLTTKFKTCGTPELDSLRSLAVRWGMPVSRIHNSSHTELIRILSVIASGLR